MFDLPRRHFDLALAGDPLDAPSVKHPLVAVFRLGGPELVEVKVELANGPFARPAIAVLVDKILREKITFLRLDEAAGKPPQLVLRAGDS